MGVCHGSSFRRSETGTGENHLVTHTDTGPTRNTDLLDGHTYIFFLNFFLYNFYNFFFKDYVHSPSHHIVHGPTPTRDLHATRIYSTDIHIYFFKFFLYNFYKFFLKFMYIVRHTISYIVRHTIWYMDPYRHGTYTHRGFT